MFIFRSEQDIVGTVNITNKQNRAAKSVHNTASVFAENSQLESPNNPRIEINAKEFGNDGYIFAAWDRVENATKYVFKLYRDNEEIFKSNVADSEKPRVGLADRWSDANIAGNVGKYYFTVSASDGGVNYLNSEASDSPNFDVALTQTCGTPTNLKVENRVLSWGKVENAVAYNVSIKSGRGSGSFVTTQTQYELSDYDKNDVVISVMALGDKINFKNSEESVLEVNIPPILIDSPQNLVITKNKISWDRMLGDVESYDYTIYDNKTGIHTQTTNTCSSYAYVNLGHGEYYFTVVAVVYSNSAYENSRAAKSEVLSLIAPPISGSVRITGELTYNSSLHAEYTGEADKHNLEYVWYRDGELINAESTSAYYLLKKEDVGHIISVKVSDSRNYEGELTATTVQEVQRAKFREPFPSPRVASDNIGNMILALPADVSFGFRAEFNKIWYGVQTSGEIQWSQSSALGKIVEGETYCFYLRFEDSDCYYGGTSVGHTYSLKSQPHITNIVPQISGESITISGIDGYTVQWYVGFNKIDGATNASYTFSPKDKGKVVYARVYYGGTEVYKTAYQTVPGKINANQLNNTLPILLIILGGFAFAVTCIGVLFLLHTKFWWLK